LVFMAIFDELKSVGKVLQEAGKIEQYRQILDALQKLLEMQKKIEELETENKKLKEEFEVKETLIPEGNVYWVSNGENKNGPYCTRCWDVDHKLVRLHAGMVSGRLYCPNCDKTAKAGQISISSPNAPRINRGR